MVNTLTALVKPVSQSSTQRASGALLVTLVVLLSAASPSWSWVRRSFGWRGPRFRVSIGAPLWPYWSSYYDYDPYYGPYYPYYPPLDYYGSPYADPTPALQQDDSNSSYARRSGSQESSIDLKTVKNRLYQMRKHLDYKYDDGDITKAQRDAGLRYLKEIEKLAKSEAADNGGRLTADQANSLLRQIDLANPAVHNPSEPYPEVEPVSAAQTSAAPASKVEAPASSRRTSTAVSDLLLELRALLDQKLKDKEITKPQYDAEKSYLMRVEQQSNADAQANGGALSADQEDQVVQELHQAYYAIVHNFVVQ
jgi:hypothetical protein